MKIFHVMFAVCLTTQIAGSQVHPVTYIQFPGLPAEELGRGCAINDEGTVAANSSVQTNPTTVIAYTVNAKGEFQLLENLAGTLYSEVSAINNRGEVLGYAVGFNGINETAVIWRDGIPAPILIPPPATPGNSWRPSPLDFRGSDEVLLFMFEQSPTNSIVGSGYFFLKGSQLIRLPEIPVGGPISSVGGTSYKGFGRGGELIGMSTLNYQGTNQTRGFRYHNGQFHILPVENVYVIFGGNGQGEIFGQLLDQSLFVWREGEMRNLGKFIATDIITFKGLNQHGQSCSRLRLFRHDQSVAFRNIIFDTTGGTRRQNGR